jgi:hypothetical protein
VWGVILGNLAKDQDQSLLDIGAIKKCGILANHMESALDKMSNLGVSCREFGGHFPQHRWL